LRIVIVGAGAVGSDLAHRISRREHDVVVLEKDPQRLEEIHEQLDCQLVVGNGCDPRVLRDLSIADCDLLAAVTDSDEINIISCLMAHRFGARSRVARVRQEEYYLDDRLILEGVDLAINPHVEAVHAVREILFHTAATDVYEFAGGRLRILGTRVEADALAAGKTLSRLRDLLGERLALVATIIREGQTLIPRGDTVVQPEDQVYLAGERATIDRSLLYFHGRSEPLEKVMIVGANVLGLDLARGLLAAGVKVKLIDRSEEKCRRAAEQLHRALILHGDGTDTELLASEGVEEMDGFVSLSADEETNVMACLLARYYGAGKTICRVERPNYVPLLPLIGIDAAVSPRLSTAARIARFVKSGAVVSAEDLGFSGSEILQLRVGHNCRCSDRTVAEVAFPREAVLVAVVKGDRVIVPHGDTMLHENDQVVVFALPEAVSEVERYFLAR
jgi:trk system potassium uptake protein TrkA